jgi:DNA-binding NtrC family response regulator
MAEVGIYGPGILLVDDEEHIRELLVEELRDVGFVNIFCASNGLECMSIIQEKGEEIVLVVLDIRMSDMTGLEVVRNLTNLYEAIIGIVFYTAYEEYHSEARKLGNERILNLDYVRKSGNVQPLIDSITQNTRLVLEKREKLKKGSYQDLIGRLDGISSKTKDILSRIEKIEKHKPSFLEDIGKGVIITIILAIFVIASLFFGLGDFLKKLIG